MHKYAVFGNPITHSLSPKIHQYFAKQFNIKLIYKKILVNNFKVSSKNFINNGGCGFNITVPFKEDAYHFVNNLSENAKCAKAVNTIKITNGITYGDNTDGIGLTQDLINNIGIDLNNKIILILGAGGAAKGIIPTLLKYQPNRLMIANRTAIKAQNLAQEFSKLGKTCGFGLEQVKHTPVDLIINATSSSIDGLMPNINSGCMENAICYDLMYGKQTLFMQFAKINGANSIFNGWGMLVEQAAKSFEIWFDKKPDTSYLIKNPL